MSEITLFGISNCDSCRKARNWLDEHGITYKFHDFDVNGVPSAEMIRTWCQTLGSETVLNRRSTTFRSLTDAERSLESSEAIAHLIHRHPRLLKRPLLQSPKGYAAGFTAESYSGILNHV
jgi:Spx/MgsR family transcriptional regulator